MIFKKIHDCYSSPIELPVFPVILTQRNPLLLRGPAAAVAVKMGTAVCHFGQSEGAFSSGSTLCGGWVAIPELTLFNNESAAPDTPPLEFLIFIVAFFSVFLRLLIFDTLCDSLTVPSPLLLPLSPHVS